MTHSVRHLLLIGLSILAVTGYALAGDGVSPEDFAYGLELSVEAPGGLNALPLPDRVYTALARADFGDLRVFDSGGKVVAHTLHTPDGQQPPERWTSVARFPLPVEPPPTGGASRIRIETRADGSIVDIRPATPGHAARQTKTGHHILDLSAVEAPVDRLRVAFAAAHQGLTRIRIESSTDLARWHPIVTKATLGVLEYQGHRLGRREVALPVRTYTYLRLTWSEPLPPGDLEEVAVRKPHQINPAPRAEIPLSPLETETVDGRTFIHYEAVGHRPVDRVRVDLPTAGTLARVALFSRPNEQAGWRRHHGGLVYRLIQDGVELSSDTVRIRTNSDRHWRLEILSDPALLTQKPTLVLGWRPHRLVFAATNGGPFRLAYGSTRAPAVNSHLDSLLRTLEQSGEVADLPLAKPGEPYVLGGEERLEGGGDAWKRYLLWGGMILAVGLIGGLALRLYGQVKQVGNEDGSKAG